MRSRGQRILSYVTGVALLVGVLTAVAMRPASANHGSRTLQASPEVQVVGVGATATITPMLSAAADDTTGPIQIDAEVEGNGPANTDGDTPETPDATCTVVVGSRSCAIAVKATRTGTNEVRVWIDHDGRDEIPTGGSTEADRAEPRLANETPDGNTAAGSETPSFADCRQPEDYTGAPDVSGTFQPCGAKLAPSAPDEGAADNTDVVEVSWVTVSQPGLDCVTPNGLDSFVETDPTADVTVTCTAKNVNGTVRIDGENVGGDDSTMDGNGVNDTDDSSAAPADYGDASLTGDADADGCSAAASGGVATCTITIEAETPPITGPAILCFWIDGDNDDALAPAAGGSGFGNDGEGCADERVGDAELDDTTDRVRIRWTNNQPAALTSIDLEPETGTNTTGNVRSVTATVLDQFGDPFLTATDVFFEFFDGSAHDPDGNTPDEPEGDCTTSTRTGSCTVQYVGEVSGSDVLCGWFGADPAMAGSGTAATCAGETRAGDNSVQRVDVTSYSWFAPPPPTTTTTAPPAGTSQQGYTLVGTDGGIFNYGTSKFHGSMAGQKLNGPIIGIAHTPGGGGYWLVASDGGIFSFGDAKFYGSMGGKPLNAPVIGMEPTPDGTGYWLFASDGGIFSFGSAKFHGSMGGKPINKPVVNMRSTSSGTGYWLVAEDGGIFAFNAPFHGSMGDKPLNQPVFDMAPTSDDSGYWLLARDGGVFAFKAPFHGAATGSVNGRAIGIGTTPTTKGYWIADSRGAVFSYGDALFLGDRRSSANNAAMVDFATVPPKR